MTTEEYQMTTEELQTPISKLKKGKSPDSKGIRAEDVKACDAALQRDYWEKGIHAWRLEEGDDKSDTQERRRGKCE